MTTQRYYPLVLILLTAVLQINLHAQTTVSFEVSPLSGPPNTDHLTDMVFFDELEGWVISPTRQDGFYHTTNGGVAWQSETLPGMIGFGVNSICNFGNTLWVTGFAGEIWKKVRTDDIWTKQTSGLFSSFHDIFFVNESRGWAVGNNGRIVATTDGGETWVQQISGTSNSLHEVHFLDESTGWAVGDWTVLQTVDGGANWTTRNPDSPEQYRGILAVDDTRAFLTSLIGSILETTNSGSTWNSIEKPYTGPQSGLYFVTSKLGWVYTNGIFNVTTDGGSTWNENEEIEGYLSGHFYGGSEGFLNIILMHLQLVDLKWC